MKYLLSILLVLAVTSCCTGEERIDATNLETWRESLDDIRYCLKGEQAELFSASLSLRIDVAMGYSFDGQEFGWNRDFRKNLVTEDENGKHFIPELAQQLHGRNAEEFISEGIELGVGVKPIPS